MADAAVAVAGAAAVAFLVVAAVAAAAAAFRVAVAAVFRGPVEEISPEEAPLGRAASIVGLARGIFPTAAAEAVVWPIPGTPHRATEVPLASD